MTGFSLDERNARLANLLTYSGTLPLLICDVAQIFNINHLDPIRTALDYSAIIVSFLSGIHWAIYLLASDRCRRNLFLYSNGIALSAWAALLVNPIAACAILALCFLALLKIDRELVGRGLYSAWYWTLRRNATAVVTLALVVLGFENLR